MRNGAELHARDRGAHRHGVLLACLWVCALGCDDPERRDAGVDGADAAPTDASLLDSGRRDAGSDAGDPRPAPPARLSEAGLFAEGVDGPYAAGVLSYSVRYPLWTDGLEKRRHLWLPAGTSIDVSDPDHWAFPEGTRVFKEFRLAGQPIETRLLWKTGPGVEDWVYVSYLYRPDGTDADPVPEGAPDALRRFHDVPDTDGCRNCHQGSGDFVIGISAMQLDRDSYDAWVASGALPGDAPFAEPPGDATERAALGHLHGNCGHCHGELHPLATRRTLRLFLPVGTLDPIAAPAVVTGVDAIASHNLGGTTRIFIAGRPDDSQAYVRMGFRDDNAMPPLGTERVDIVGRTAVRAWIEGL